MNVDQLVNLVIHSGNELPPRKRRGGSVYDSVLDKFEEGQNVYFDDAKLANQLYAAAQNYGRKNNKTFAMRTAMVDGQKKIGIWRVK